MTKSEPPQSFPRHSRELVYATISKGHPPKQFIDFMSESSEIMLGPAAREFQADPSLYMALVHPGDVAALLKSWERTLESGKSSVSTYRMKPRKSKKYVWVEDRLSVRLGRRGSYIGVTGSVVEITGRKRVEDTLKEEGERLRGMLDDAVIGIYRTTPDGRILFANRSLLDMLGYECLEELSARNLNREGYEPGYSREQFRRAVEAEGSARGLECAWKKKDGMTLFVRENARVVRDGKGKVVYYEGTVEDISDRKEAEEKKSRLNRILRMMSGVSQSIIHETTRDALFTKVCSRIVAEGRYLMAWIGIYDEESGIVKPLSWNGAEDGYLHTVVITTDDRPGGKSPAASAVTRGEASVCNDIRHDPVFKPWASEALKRGYRSAGAFPMHAGGNVVGVLCVYSDTEGQFGVEETRLLSELADDVGFALWALEARQRQKAADEVIKDREFWLKESQRVARLGSYVYEVRSGNWSGSDTLLDIVGIDASYKRDFRGWLALINPSDRRRLVGEIKKGFKTRKPFGLEFNMIRPVDGEVRWVWGTAEFIPDASGKPTRLFGTLQDITARRKMEEELRKERILLRTLVDNLPNSIYVKDDKYRKILSNPTNVRHAGMSSESEVLGKTDFQLFPREVAEGFFEDDRRVIERGEAVIDREEFIFDEAGGKRWQLTSKIPVRDENGTVVGLVGIGTDITERRRAEEEKQRERLMLKTLFDHLPASVWVKDKNYRRTAVNRAHISRTALFSGKPGLSENDFLGKTDFEIYDKEKAAQFLADDQRVIRDGETILNREEMVFDSKGRRHWQLVSKVPLQDENGEVIGLVGIVTDITRQKEAEEARTRERTLLRTLIDNLPNSIFVKDKNLRKVIANPAHIQRVAQSSRKEVTSESQLVGRTDFEIYPEEMARAFHEEDEKILREETAVVNREQYSSGPDGLGKWELISKIPLRDEKGEITGFVGITNEITAQKRVEEALRRERILLKTIIDHIPNAIFAKDNEFRKILVNPAHIERMSEHIGLNAAEELLGKTDFDVCPREMAEEYFREDRKVIRDGKTVLNKPVQEIDKSGQKHWELLSKIPMRDTEGNIIGLVGVSTDITALREAEEKLRASEERLSRITDSIRDAIYSIDGRTGEFEYLSPAFGKMLGYSTSDIASMGGRWAFLRIVIQREEKDVPDPVINEMQVETSGMPPIWQNWWVCKDGSQRFIEDYSVPVYEGKRLVRVDGVLRDITERKKAEDEAERERILLRTLIDNFPYAIYVKDRNYRKVIANPIDVVHFAGLSSESEIIGKTDFDIYPKEVAERLLADDRRVILEGESVIGREERIVDARGKEHWLLTTKVPLRDRDDDVIGLVGVGIDVTEKRAVDEALRRSEAELRALFESMNDFIVSIDVEGRYVKIAPTNQSLLSRPAGELVGRTLHELFPREDADKFLSVVRESLRLKRTVPFEYRLEMDGVFYWFAANVSPMSETSVIWVARDVTEQKEMERELASSEKKYRELVENALVGVYKINLSGTIVYANQAMADMLEYDSPQDMMSVSSSSFYSKLEDMQSFIEALQTYGRTGKSKEVELVTKNGKTKNVLLSASLDRDVISGMAKDITEIRTLERQFIQTQKLEGLGNIAAGIAHDFNNILGVIVGYSELLGESSYDREKFRRGMQAIAKASDRGKSLVRQLLTFARKTEITFETLVLNNAVMEIERLVTETFPKTVEIHTNLMKELPPVLADATQIHQVLLNLSVNARDAMPKGGKLTISTDVIPGSSLMTRHPEAASREYVEVSVADTGAGMDEATRQRIFEPFFTTKGVGKGTGLGLSVVYGIVESHRGLIDVESELGFGTTFRIYIPAVEPSVINAEVAATTGDGKVQGNATILVIEDEEMLRELLKTTLGSKGYHVMTAKEGEEGVETFREHSDRISLVISDLGLPKLSGAEVVARIRDISPNARVAIASGFIDPEVKSDLENKGITHFIQKPYKTSDVLRIVGDILREER